MGSKKNRRVTDIDSGSMGEKLVVQVEERSIWSVFAGMVTIFLGIMLVVVGVVAILLYRVEPKLDKSVDIPELTQLPADTSARALTVRGSVDKSIKRVAVYVNDKMVEENLWVDNGNFKYEYALDKEGVYKLQAASITGFPVRKRSERSPIMAVNADWTAPSKNISLSYEKEVDTNAVKVSGKIEALSTVIFSNGGTSYVGKADKEGKFSVTLPLSLGDNNFAIEIRDSAGNSVKADSTLAAKRVTGSINGGGVVDTPDLPEAAGELEAAMAFLLGNKIMSTLGLIALAVLLINSALVAVKIRRYSI